MTCFSCIITKLYFIKYPICYNCKNKATHVTEKQYYSSLDKTEKLNHLTYHTKCENCISDKDEKKIKYVTCDELLQSIF